MYKFIIAAIILLIPAHQIKASTDIPDDAYRYTYFYDAVLIIVLSLVIGFGLIVLLKAFRKARNFHQHKTKKLINSRIIDKRRD